jgi:pimeloyl-ACP methyl ester carboxylesterase
MNPRAINFFGSDDYRNSPEVLRKSMSIFVNEDFTNDLSKIKTPTLIVWGAKDTQTPLWQGELMNMKIKDSKLAVIDNGDHYSFLRDWNKFAKALDDFLIEK